MRSGSCDLNIRTNWVCSIILFEKIFSNETLRVVSYNLLFSIQNSSNGEDLMQRAYFPFQTTHLFHGLAFRYAPSFIFSHLIFFYSETKRCAEQKIQFLQNESSVKIDVIIGISIFHKIVSTMRKAPKLVTQSEENMNFRSASLLRCFKEHDKHHRHRSFNTSRSPNAYLSGSNTLLSRHSWLQ